MFLGSRFVPQLNSNDVADRVIQAIRTNEALAVMPGYFCFFLPFKWSVLRKFCVFRLLNSLALDRLRDGKA